MVGVIGVRGVSAEGLRSSLTARARWNSSSESISANGRFREDRRRCRGRRSCAKLTGILTDIFLDNGDTGLSSAMKLIGKGSLTTIK